MELGVVIGRYVCCMKGEIINDGDNYIFPEQSIAINKGFFDSLKKNNNFVEGTDIYGEYGYLRVRDDIFKIYRSKDGNHHCNQKTLHRLMVDAMEESMRTGQYVAVLRPLR